jgi:hypothetical protein
MSQTHTRASIEGILKDDYVRKGIVDNVNKSTELLKRITSTQSSHGERHVFSTQLGTSQSAGVAAEYAPLPAPGMGEYTKPWGYVVRLYNRFRVSGPALSSTKGNKAAFGSTITQAINDTRDGMRLEVQRQSWSDGSGILGMTSAEVTASVTVPVHRPYGYEYSGTLSGSDNVLLFRRRQVLYFEDVGYRTVVAVNPAAGTITLNAVITVDADVAIYKGEAATTGLEIEGVGKMLGTTGDYMGVTRDGIPEWQGNVVDAADVGGKLSEDLLRISRNVARRNGTRDPNLAICGFDVKRFYENTQKSFKRHVAVMDLKGGATAIDFDGMPLVDDRDAPPQRMYFFDTTSITWFVMEEVDWANADGTMLKWVDGYDAWEAFLRTYKNLGCYSPANQTMIHGITGWEAAQDSSDAY